MRNYIKAELYRNFNRLYFWCYSGVVAALLIILNIIFKSNNVANLNLTAFIGFGIMMFSMPIYMILPFIEMVTSEEQKNQTLKNSVSFGIPRYKIVISKIIVTVILSFIAAIIILIAYFGSALIFFGVGKDFSIDILYEFMKRIGVSVILWIAAITVGTFLALIFKKNNIFAFAYFCLFSIPSKIVKLLMELVSDKFKHVYNMFITTQITNLSSGEPSLAGKTLTTAAIIGILYIVVFTILSVFYFNKKEIN